ncbi:MaoC family dehydratase [Nocardioides sp. JQ2195]|nr:MaoC family dehydratase [Nocardioides sp. JQ2195]
MMAPRVLASMDEVQQVLDEPLGTTEWVEVDQESVDRFADLTGDHQWIHVDPERAASSAYGGTIAHGYLTLARLPAFAATLYRLEAGESRLNYGVNKVRFPAPVPVGSRIRATPTIVGIREVPAGDQVTVRWVVECDRATKPVCVAETLTLVVTKSN